MRLRSIDIGTDVRELIADLDDELELIGIAEDCISSAQRRHGEALVIRDRSGRVISEKGPIWRSFRLLEPTHPLLRRANWLYREHCREILDRVAAGEDTRPGTGVEALMALLETSLKAPLAGAASGLCFRLFHRHCPDRAREVFLDSSPTVGDYEGMYGSAMDDLETKARHRLQQQWRRLPRKEPAPSPPSAAPRQASGST